MADALDVPERGTRLIAKVEAAFDAVDLAEDGSAPRVLFILSMQGGRIMAAGAETGADAIIRLAGGQNALAGFDDYLPVRDEAVLDAAPETILMMDRGGDHAAAEADLFTHPAIAATPAGRARSVVRMNGLLLLGFGSRTPEAVLALARALGTAEGT